MGRAVMISIQPKWCELIASGRKTVEVRKTRPNAILPLKCYIYCTTSGSTIRTTPKPYCKNVDGSTVYRQEIMNGHVIGEFVCHNIFPFWPGYKDGNDCLTFYEQEEYLGQCGRGWGWKISDLVIYDKPKKLGDFKRWNRTEDNSPCAHTKALYEPCETCKECNLTRPFQSWGYVEELHDAD